MLDDVLQIDSEKVVHLSHAPHSESYLSYHQNTLAHWFVADAVVLAGALLTPADDTDPTAAAPTTRIRRADLNVHSIRTNIHGLTCVVCRMAAGSPHD